MAASCVDVVDGLGLEGEHEIDRTDPTTARPGRRRQAPGDDGALQPRRRLRGRRRLGPSYRQCVRSPPALLPRRPRPIRALQPDGSTRHQGGRRCPQAWDKSKRVHFKTHAAIPCDQRIMSFPAGDRVSLLTLEGRVKVPFVVGPHDARRLEWPKGQSDLVYRDGRWSLYVTVDVPDVFAGAALHGFRGGRSGHRQHRHRLRRRRPHRGRCRADPQEAQPPAEAAGAEEHQGAKKKIRRMRDKEARFRRHQNHVISKAIVRDARRTDRGIALEDLKGIRGRVKARGGDARNRLGTWAFAQLGGFIMYKARLAGVAVEFIDPSSTSRTCHECGHCERSNRQSQGRFHCRGCGHRAHADVNAARNIRARALSKRAPGLGNQPGDRVAYSEISAPSVAGESLISGSACCRRGWVITPPPPGLK